MKNIFKKWGLALLLTLGACNLDGDLVNPNEVSVSGADVDLLMNAVQLNFADFFSAASGTVDPLVRMRAMTGGFRYQTAYSPIRLDGVWASAYQGVLVNIKTLRPLAAEKGLTTHVAVCNILEAYTWMTLVDVFGDVPALEALQGPEGNFNPKTTPGADIYAVAIDLLGKARTELAKTTDAGLPLSRDIYYAGSRANWTALCNTLELKAWLNIREVPARTAEANTKIATFVDAAGASLVNLVDTEAENFTYKFSNTTVPDSRHPWYNQYYGPNPAGAGGYWGTYYMHEVFGKWDPENDTDPTAVVQDPRWRYYFYRQVGSIDPVTNGFDVKALGCSPTAPPPHYISGNVVFCVFEPGFYGRDHGDASGTPPDGPVLTAAGVYPAGGRADNTLISNAGFQGGTLRGQGADGRGIWPIWMAAYTDFVKAEVAANAGNNALAKTLLTTAVTNSIASVKAFATSRTCPTTSPCTLTAGREPSTATYIAKVQSLFDDAAVKQDVISKEFWIALMGNGMEAYNLYRRTSAPRNLQPLVQVSADPFFRSMVYPATYANLNKEAVQKNVGVTNKVFWDNNADNLH